MTDLEAIKKAHILIGGWAFLPKSGWRKQEGGYFYPNENQFGEVFGTPPENPPLIKHPKYMYEVGKFEIKDKRTYFVVKGRGMTWEEAFASVKS